MTKIKAAIMAGMAAAAVVMLTVSIAEPAQAQEASSLQFTEQALLATTPAGAHTRLERGSVPRGFGADQPFVATYYFYWYDRNTNEHFINPDGSDALKEHPIEPKGYSYRRPEWHYRELRDIMDAGIDVILPVYWGNPADRALKGHLIWGDVGLPPLVKAAERITAEGRKPPRIGMFYDTSSLQFNSANRRIDLSTADGRAWFYVTIRDYFSQIPPKFWATIEGKPIVFLYGAGFAAGGTDDPKLLDYVRERFARDFGGATPYIVREVSWRLPSESSYAWGAAFGLQTHGVAALGPGYDDSPVPGRTTPKRDREGGAFYRRNWEQLLALHPKRRPRMAVIETWNEFHEGTDIAHTKEFGRQYIDMTREFATRWKRNERHAPRGPYSDAKEVSVSFDRGIDGKGVAWKSGDDGRATVTGAGTEGWLKAEPNPHSPTMYLYFDVDDSFYLAGEGAMEVTVEYLDEGQVPFQLEYDSYDPAALLNGTYRPTAPVQRTGSGAWKTATFRLPDARFSNRQNNAADFRLASPGSDMKVRRVTVRKR